MNRLRVDRFGTGDALEPHTRLTQGSYLRRYLADLGCSTVVEESAYFDRDYLAEYTSFYASSSKGYGNRCRRIHFFKGDVFDRQTLRRALNGSPRVQERLQSDYLGFAVIRPIPAAPFGRTVLRWYDDPTPKTPRRTAKRQYLSHLAGLRLTVTGLAWQQQDTGVGACATVAIWSMLHSSAFDPHYLVPTTADITRAAHRTASLGARVFPSAGLTNVQLLEAIKEFGLNPFVIEGDIRKDGKNFFSPIRFSSLCAAMIRSGYPVLVIGDIPEGRHAICAVGFRESPAPFAPFNDVALEDATTKHFYVHDDNIGPNIRCEVGTDSDGVVNLTPSAPNTYGGAALPNPAGKYGPFKPLMLVGGVHHDLRVSLLPVYQSAISAAEALQRLLLWQNDPQKKLGLTISVRFERLSDYMRGGLASVHPAPSTVLGRTRLQLQEEVAPMSLRVGVVRLGLGSRPVADILFDTSDSERQLSAFCTLTFLTGLAKSLKKGGLGFDFGTIVESS